jgi:hypothetical protein
MAYELKTRYLVIRLDLTNQISQASSNNAKFTNGTTTKFIYAYSGGTGIEGVAYQKVDCTLNIGIGYSDHTATIDIYGMELSDINTFTRANLQGNLEMYAGNLVSVYAGYTLGSDGLPPLAYTGYVVFSGPDYNVSRDRKFTIHSKQFFDIRQINLKPTNIKGEISLDNLFRYICQLQNINYRGINVTGNAYNPIFTGSLQQQLQQAVDRYGYHMAFIRSPGELQNILYIAPINTPFITKEYVISAQNNDMIGFPIVENYGFTIKCYYNPNLFIGQAIRVNSLTIDYINDKTLYINQMIHQLHNREELWQSTLQLNIYSLAGSASQ